MSATKNLLFDVCEQLAEVAPLPIRDDVFDALITCEHMQPHIGRDGIAVMIDGARHTIAEARERIRAAIDYGEWWLISAVTHEQPQEATI